MSYFPALFLILQKMNVHIKNKNTGNAKEFAAKIKISKRSIYVYLEILKTIINKPDVDISYNPEIRSFEYSKKGCLDLKAQWKSAEQCKELQFSDYTFVYFSTSTNKGA
jgi:hypothetical protein